MSRIKEFYHEEIIRGLHELSPLQEAQILEQEAEHHELETL